MRIAVFLDQSFPPDSRVENEAYSLVKAGHEVHLFSLNYKQLSPAKEIYRGIHVHRIQVSNLIFKLSALAYTFPFYHNALKPAIKKFLDLTKPEAIHVHDMLMAKAVISVNQKFRLPLTLDLHENRPEILQYYPHLNRFPTKQLISIEAWRNAQNALIKSADHVVMVTPEAIEVAVEDTGRSRDDFFDIANTIELEIYDEYPIDQSLPERFSSDFNLVYVGDTGTRRGIDTAIKAVASLKNRITNLRLIIVGKSTQDVDSRHLAKSLGVAEMISWEGWQDVSLFPSYIACANVCLSPFHRNKHHDTTLANKLFQYMAGSKPIIVSDCPSQVNIINDAECGLVHKAEEHESLARCILKYVEDPDLQKSHGLNARKAIESKYNWALTSKALIDHYNQLASQLSSGSDKP